MIAPDATKVDPFDAVCGAPLLEANGAVEERASRTLLATLRQGARAHGAAVVSCGLGDEAPSDWRERSERLLEYRRIVSNDVIGPLAEALGTAGPPAWVEDATGAAYAAALEGCLALPAESVEPWPEDALRAHPWDGVRRRLGKGLGRLVSQARHAGRDREVPVRALAHRHTVTDLARRLEAWGETTLRDWADWSGRLEGAWVSWAESALPCLIRAEREGEEVAQHWSGVRDAADGLQDQLEALLVDAPSADPRAEAERSGVESRAVLEAEMALVGSFLEAPTEAQAPDPQAGPASRAIPAHREWTDGVANRLRLYDAVLGILSGATAVERRLVWRFRDRCMKGLSQLPEIAEVLDGMRATLAAPPSTEELRRNLEELEGRVTRALTPAPDSLPERDLVDETVVAGADATVDALIGMIRQAPVTLMLHAADEEPPRRGQRVESRSMQLQELARQAFDALRIERIRSSTEGLIVAVETARRAVEELPEVYAFAHEAALQELAEGEADARSRAVGLVTEALESVAESLRAQPRDIDRAVAEAQSRLAGEISGGSLGLLDRTAAGFVHGRLLAARSRASDLLMGAVVALRPRVAAARTRLFRAWVVVRGLFERALRTGSAMVGGPVADGATSAQSMGTLAHPEQVTSGLPLVYQRLFTLGPLTDPALLVGREPDLTRALDRWRRWQSRDGVPLILTGRPGSGVTSFLSALEARIGSDGPAVVRVDLGERITDEAGLATALAEPLGLEPVESVDSLVTRILASAEGSIPSVVAIDNLEHLYLRMPGGTDLIERLLTLLAETEPRIFWIGGITTSAWQIVCAAEPAAVSQVDVLQLEPLDEDDLRAAVLLRHRRSGLALRFLESPSRGAELRRRIRRRLNSGADQKLYQDDFFEQLERTSSGNLRLALFQWMVSADFSTGEGVLMRPPERHDFSVLDSLGLTQNFTLKAFVEHRTLTLEEHDLIFRLPRHESFQIVESLQNRHLVQVVERDGDAPGGSEVTEGLRYRLRPLLTGAILSHLQGRNIVH